MSLPLEGLMTSTRTPKPVPKGLAESGKALWRSIVKSYDLRPDELVWLEQACRAQDRIQEMEAERDGRLTAKGSMGQLIAHPLLQEVRTHEAQIAGLLARLKLPDLAGENAGEKPRSTQARKAAQSRWAAAHGA